MNFEEIFKGLLLSKEDKKIISSKLKETKVTKGEILLYPNDTANFQYYVQQGCLRSFFTDKSSKEHTIQFAITDWWIGDYTAFFKKEKAILQIECIQDASLLRLSREDMIEIFDEIPNIERYFRIKTESYIGSFQKRIIGDLSKTAKEQYIDFVNTYPNIEQLVKNYHIASYLGITSESLSRVRKEIARN
ncbi:Crp/Fnr family transcriptional regulator [Aquimarina sp. BL5]|uniref:Crp/Fnr family transcriptional regulator n=1 Tax=Aquimarina sp. BL5 TaxID=1714860 RepID=UPI000E52CD14|nr:Crp/Fnr family transcriptional regulator [Aquimarina sp. BL5]AXT53686.1 Crp/Fnr family transcriptional regulator [Aquimarina sp. BL5]RKM91586.1 Crp/Fnr family transcriptional regulator [Aquimarina sp. BL5]